MSGRASIADLALSTERLKEANRVLVERVEKLDLFLERIRKMDDFRARMVRP